MKTAVRFTLQQGAAPPRLCGFQLCQLSVFYTSPSACFMRLERKNGDFKPPRNRSGDSDTHNARSQVRPPSTDDANNKAWEQLAPSSYRRGEREWLFRPLSLRLVTNTLVLRSSCSAARSVVSRMGAGLKRMRIRERRGDSSRGYNGDEADKQPGRRMDVVLCSDAP